MWPRAVVSSSLWLWLLLTATQVRGDECPCCAASDNGTAVSECSDNVQLQSTGRCECCVRCTATAGQRCGPQHEQHRRCIDGLSCVDGVCTAEQRACRSDTECTADQFCLGRVCFDPCTIFDPCKQSLKNGVCRTRQHRPVCSCPARHRFVAAVKACVPDECLTPDGEGISVGRQMHSNQCRDTCVCTADATLNCTSTICPPGSYLPGSFDDDELCVELANPTSNSSQCCVNVFCSNIASEKPGDSFHPTQTSKDPVNSLPSIEPTSSTSVSVTSSPASVETSTWTQDSSTTRDIQLYANDTSHNATTITLPSGGGELSYSAAGDEDDAVVVRRRVSGEERSLRISQLQPSTQYVFTWVSGTKQQQTDLQVLTLPGCLVSYSSESPGAQQWSVGVGSSYHVQCLQTCYCSASGQVDCRPRCALTRSHDVTSSVSGGEGGSCRHVVDPDDPECCVKLECTLDTTDGSSETRSTDNADANALFTSTTEESQRVESPASVNNDGGEDSHTPASTTVADTISSTDNNLPDAGDAATQLNVMSSSADPLNNQPTLLVTSKSADSVTLAWDDFKSQTYTGGYVAEYRTLGDVKWSRRRLPQLQHGGILPLITIDQLLPDTQYLVRVSLEGHLHADSLFNSTETISFTTDDGCRYNNRTYALEEHFKKGCEALCTCSSSGHVTCDRRCREPLYTRGEFEHNQLCHEQSVDECCVTVACGSDVHSHTTNNSTQDACAYVHCFDGHVCDKVVGDDGVVSARCVCPASHLEVSVKGKVVCTAVENSVPEELAHPANDCTFNIQHYKSGETFFKGCNFSCLCENAEIVCKPRCVELDVPDSPNCRLTTDPNDQCCQVYSCQQDKSGDENVQLINASGCSHNGVSHKIGEQFIDDCLNCTCLNSGSVQCVPRCDEQLTGASCRSADSLDECCVPAECVNSSVTAEQRQLPQLVGRSTLLSPAPGRRSRVEDTSEELALSTIDQLNSTSSRIRVRVSRDVLDALLWSSSRETPLTVHWYYGDQPPTDQTAWISKNFTANQLSVLDVNTVLLTVNDLTRPERAWLRLSFGDLVSRMVYGRDLMSPTAQRHDSVPPTRTPGVSTVVSTTQRREISTETTAVTLTSVAATQLARQPSIALDNSSSSHSPSVDQLHCQHRGRSFHIAEEFHDGCDQFCICTRAGVDCARVQCPHNFGTDIINPDCLQWQPDPDFVPSPPSCCPKMLCVNDGSCVYEGHRLRHFDEVPQQLSGCHQQCYCEFGNITCQSVCAAVPAVPPVTLQCPLHLARLLSDGCCKQWQCAPPLHNVNNNSHMQHQGELLEATVRVLDAHTVVFSFQIAHLLAALPGQTVFMFTELENADTTQWSRRVYQDAVHESAQDIGASQLVQYTVSSLQPHTSYVARVQHTNLLTQAALTSRQLHFHTPSVSDESLSPAKITIDAGLRPARINTTSAQVRWRRLTETELNYVDGIQLRYRDLDVNAQVWTMTPFIHRELTHYDLTVLKPDTNYEIDIVLMPFQNKSTEMVSTRPLRIKTMPVIDMYNFSISLSLGQLAASSVQVTWAGVPAPQYKYVNVYRVVYIDERQRKERHTFKLAKSTEKPAILLKLLKPSTKYQVWLEAYLKNGKKRVSEVREFVTKPAPVGKFQGHTAGDNSVASVGGVTEDGYFTSMVAAASIALLLLLVTMLLAGMLMKKSGSKKAAIITRKNGPSYENPAFKDQSSDLDMNGSNGNERFS